VEHDDLSERLQRGKVAVLSDAQWHTLAAGYEVVESHDTEIAGLLQLLRGPAGLIAVEAPKPAERTVRALADEQLARAFVDDRLRRYERMWEG
jgi:hypothetical protein